MCEDKVTFLLELFCKKPLLELKKLQLKSRVFSLNSIMQMDRIDWNRVQLISNTKVRKDTEFC